jgi:hypothetical protein
MYVPVAPQHPLTAVVPASNVANTMTEARLNRLIEGYRQIAVVPGPVTPYLVQREFGAESPAHQAETAASPPLSQEERQRQSLAAMTWLKRMATGEVPGYDVRPAEREIRLALQVEALAPLAVEATGRLTTADAQSALAAVVLDNMRPAELRALAADTLIQNVRRIGVAVTPQQIQAMIDLLPTVQEPILRAKVAAAVGALQATARQSGMRLQRYATPLPPPAAAPAAPTPPPAEPPPPAQPAPNQ